MSRSRPLAMAAFAIVCFAFRPLPASATQITMDFSGSVDLSSLIGGPASNTFSGSVTWDTTAAAEPGSTPEVAAYPVVSETFVLDGVDYTADVTGGVEVQDQVAADRFDVFVFFSGLGIFSPPLIGNSIMQITATVSGPTTMFASDALPTSLDFLTAVTSGTSDFFVTKDILVGSAMATAPAAVPEPASLLLFGTGLFITRRVVRNQTHRRG